MILLIDEDEGEPKVLERIPPWGAKDLKGYLPRLERAIALAEKDDEFRFSLDISACELERLAGERRDLVERLKELVASGRVEVVGGDYSQPHFQTFLSASALRQFYAGLEVFERILGVRPRTFAHQEPQIFEQLPQVLKALGYRHACVTMFPWWTIALDDRGPVFHSHFGVVKTSEPDSLAFWKGVDGSEIPLYLRSDATITEEAVVTAAKFLPKLKLMPSAVISRVLGWVLAKFLVTDLPFESHKGLWASPKMVCEFPDLTESGKGRLEAMKKRGRLVTIGEGIDEVSRSWPPRARVRFGTSFAHAEGEQAELLIRECWRAENRLVSAQSWCSLARTMVGFDYDGAQLDGLWKKLLKAQHHDVHWLEPIDLKRKALGWLREAIEGANAVENRAISSLGGALEEAGWPSSALRVVGRDPHRLTWPQSMRIGSAARPAMVVLEDSQGGSVRGQLKSGLADGELDLVLLSDLGVGFEFLKAKGMEEIEVRSTSRWHRFVGTEWRCELDERGWIRGLGIGGDICSPFARLSAWRKEDGWIEERAASEFLIEEGDVCTAVKVKLDFGGIPVVRELVLYREIPLVTLRFLFEFAGDEIGLSWEDETKLCLTLELDGVRDVWHSIPLGAVSMPAGYGFFSNGWTALERRERDMGLALLTRGHPRQFYRDGRLFCVLGWGGTRFSLRIPAAWDRIDRFDHRLAGKHVLEFALIPYVGDWRSSKIPILARKFLNPARVESCEAVWSDGSRRLFEIDGYSPLLVGMDEGPDGGLVVTGHECAGVAADLDGVSTESLVLDRLDALGGQRLEAIAPFQIFRAHFTPNR